MRYLGSKHKIYHFWKNAGVDLATEFDTNVVEGIKVLPRNVSMLEEKILPLGLPTENYKLKIRSYVYLVLSGLGKADVIFDKKKGKTFLRDILRSKEGSNIAEDRLAITASEADEESSLLVIDLENLLQKEIISQLAYEIMFRGDANIGEF